MPGNYTIRDEIRDYWSLRAETFDLQPGHEIFSDLERTAWQLLIKKHLGIGKDRLALDLACGTSVISHLLVDCGFKVVGVDWSDAMLEKARAKSKARNSSIEFRVGDAENTRESPDTYDVIMTRHLVWTLVDPSAAFSHWFSILKPGGKILIIDGDFVTSTLVGKLLKLIDTTRQHLGIIDASDKSVAMQKTHQHIIQQVYFNKGANADTVSNLLRNAGFQDIVVQTNLTDIHKAQGKQLSLLKSLSRSTQHRYAICACKLEV